MTVSEMTGRTSTSTSTGTSRPTRRSVLRAGVAWAAASPVAALAEGMVARDSSKRTLVLLHLSGGNDGLNTVVPHADPLYYELRPRLSRVAKDAVRIDGRVGLHASLAGLVPAYRRGRLAIVQGVGYAGPDYSHFGSCRIWASGRTDAVAHRHRTWWDVVLERRPPRSAPAAVCVGDPQPVWMATVGLTRVPVDGDAADTAQPATNPLPYRFGRIRETLAAVARVVGSTHRPDLIFAGVGGFDTHADQLEQHAQVLRELGDGLAAFQYEMERRGVADRVVTMAWSEFGRRSAENAAGGTDHGSAGPVFLLGSRVRGGLHGQAPSLKDTDFGNLIPTMDFRTLYASLAEGWLDCGGKRSSCLMSIVA
jgi:uncharacterized protein (DUF1501 family)